MKKRFLAGILTAVLAVGSIGVTAFAEDASPTLTIDEAIKYTLSSDTSYLNLVETGTLNEYSRSDTISSLIGSDVANWTSANVQLMQAETKLALQSSNEQQKKLSLQNTLTKYFMDIITAEKSLELSKQSLEITKTELNILNTKVKLGLISQTEYNTAVKDYEKSANDLAAEETSISSAYIELNRLMGKPLDSRYTLVLNFEYSEYGEVDLDRYISTSTSKNVNIKQKISDYEVASYKYDYWWTFSSSTFGKDELSIKATQAKRDVDDAKESLKLNIINAYNDMKDLEVQISSNQLELKNMKSQLSVKEAELELGKITALEVKKYSLQISQLEEKIRQQKYNHGLMVWQFEHPDVL